MTTDLIRYDLLVQDALRGVVRNVLSEAAKNGLQGDHHFFITFKTAAPGLRLSNRMRTRYPDEMTIILQHQFWDLSVTEHAFEVGLSFSNVPERLLVPFGAITSFVDPSVQFGLKFEVQEDGTAAVTNPTEAPVASEPLKALPGRRALAPVAASEPPAGDDKPGEGKFKPTLAKSRGKDEAPPTAVPASKDDAKAKKPEAGDPTKVVSIDAFRKKP
jgi:hypothetical protein